MLSDMESSVPSPAEAAATLAEAETAQRELSSRVRVPHWFFAALGSAVTVQVACTAVGLSLAGPATLWLILAGLAVFGLVAAGLLLHLRTTTGVWLGGLVSRVVGGTSTAASLSEALSLAAATWAAFEDQWVLVAVASIAGGVGYGLAGRSWLRDYHREPAQHGRGESLARLLVLVALCLVGAVLLVSLR
jgi:hypothetical protein